MTNVIPLVLSYPRNFKLYHATTISITKFLLSPLSFFGCSFEVAEHIEKDVTSLYAKAQEEEPSLMSYPKCPAKNLLGKTIYARMHASTRPQGLYCFKIRFAKGSLFQYAPGSKGSKKLCNGNNFQRWEKVSQVESQVRNLNNNVVSLNGIRPGMIGLKYSVGTMAIFSYPSGSRQATTMKQIRPFTSSEQFRIQLILPSCPTSNLEESNLNDVEYDVEYDGKHDEEYYNDGYDEDYYNYNYDDKYNDNENNDAEYYGNKELFKELTEKVVD